MEALRIKLDEDYEKGFDKERDATKLIEMKTIRLSNLNIGPTL